MPTRYAIWMPVDYVDRHQDLILTVAMVDFMGENTKHRKNTHKNRKWCTSFNF